MDYLLVSAIIVVILTTFITFKNIKYGFFLYMAFIPLMHKELFSFGVWDLLPVRLTAAGVILGSFLRFIRWFSKGNRYKNYNEIKTLYLRTFFLFRF
jgi:hypothetical protein